MQVSISTLRISVSVKLGSERMLGLFEMITEGRVHKWMRSTFNNIFVKKTQNNLEMPAEMSEIQVIYGNNNTAPSLFWSVIVWNHRWFFKCLCIFLWELHLHRKLPLPKTITSDFTHLTQACNLKKDCAQLLLSNKSVVHLSWLFWSLANPSKIWRVHLQKPTNTIPKLSFLRHPAAYIT